MSKMEDVLRRVAHEVSNINYEHALPRYEELLAIRLRESGLLLLLEVGQAMRNWDGDSCSVEEWEARQGEWDAALKEMEKLR